METLKHEYLGSGRSVFNTAPNGWMNANEIHYTINKERAGKGWKGCSIVQVLYGLSRLCPGLDWIDISEEYPIDYRHVSSNSNWRSIPESDALEFIKAMQEEQGERQAHWAKAPKRSLRDTLIKTRGSNWWTRPRSTWGKPVNEWPEKYRPSGSSEVAQPKPEPENELSHLVEKSDQAKGLKVVWSSSGNGFYRPVIDQSDSLTEFHDRDGRPLILVDKPGRQVIKAWPKVDEHFEEVINGVKCPFLKNPASLAYEYKLSDDELEDILS